MNNIVDMKIKKAIFDLLKEQSEETSPEDSEKKADSKKKRKKNMKGVISTSGAFGTGGRSKKFVTSAKARAQDDPEGLMKDLGIVRAPSGKDLEKTLSILSVSINANIVMSEAYTGARRTSDVVLADQQQRSLDVVAVGLNKLDRKNGIRFLAHTLVAAQNANLLNLTNGLQFAEGQNNSIIIYTI